MPPSRVIQEEEGIWLVARIEHEARNQEDKTREKTAKRWKGRPLLPEDEDEKHLVFAGPPPRSGALSGRFASEGTRVASAAEGEQKKAPYPKAKTKAEKAANRRAGFMSDGRPRR